MTLSSVPAGLSRTHLSTCSPRVVLLPIVQRVAPGITVEKPNAHEGRDKCALLAVPLGGQFNIFIRHASQIAVAAICDGPQDQAYEVPASRLAKSTDQLLGLRMSRKSNRDARVAGHRQAPISCSVAQRARPTLPRCTRSQYKKCTNQRIARRISPPPRRSAWRPRSGSLPSPRGSERLRKCAHRRTGTRLARS